MSCKNPEFLYNKQVSGCGPAGLRRMHGVHEIGGSNPLTPTTSNITTVANSQIKPQMKPIIGFSLNGLYRWSKDLDFLLKNLRQNVPAAQAIELSHHWTLKEILKNARHLKRYRFRSFHLPKKNYPQWIKDLNQHQRQLNLNHLVIHPNVIKNWAAIIESKIPIAAENMDKYKKKFKTMAEMAKLFRQRPALKLCLDINHLATQFPGQMAFWQKKFKKQIKEIHLSAINRNYYSFAKQPKHALCLFDKNILKGLKIKDRPVILEGAVPAGRWDLAKKEFALVNAHLKTLK